MNTAFEVHKGRERLQALRPVRPHIKNRGAGNPAGAPSTTAGAPDSVEGGHSRRELTCSAPFPTCPLVFPAFPTVARPNDNYTMDWRYEGRGRNIAPTAQVPVGSGELTIVPSAETMSKRSSRPAGASERSYAAVERFVNGWKRYIGGPPRSAGNPRRALRLYNASAMVLKAHEDKT